MRWLASLGPGLIGDRLLPAQYVKPFVKRSKNDRSDAEATLLLRRVVEDRATDFLRLCFPAKAGRVGSRPPDALLSLMSGARLVPRYGFEFALSSRGEARASQRGGRPCAAAAGLPTRWACARI